MRPIDADAFLKDILTAGIGKTVIEYSECDIGYMIRKRPPLAPFLWSDAGSASTDIRKIALCTSTIFTGSKVMESMLMTIPTIQKMTTFVQKENGKKVLSDVKRYAFRFCYAVD